jgi:hypothetical protein
MLTDTPLFHFLLPWPFFLSVRYSLTIITPHFGHCFCRQGIPISCGSLCPQFGQPQLPPTPVMKAPPIVPTLWQPLPFPSPCPIPPRFLLPMAKSSLFASRDFHPRFLLPQQPGMANSRMSPLPESHASMTSRRSPATNGITRIP